MPDKTVLNLFVPLFLNYYCYYFIRDIRIKREDVIRYSIECNGDRGDGALFYLACQNILAQAPGIMVIRVEIDSRLLIRLNQSASMLPTVGRMTWRLSSRNCTYGEPSPPSIVSPFHRPHAHARARTHTHARLEPALPTDRLLSICIVH